ncbi:YkuS family protein [Clostridium formicaceticum]|uniref:YkuS family protein n=1 Tax=Clostridium formicaceticum TaxID=1497 RepID=A0AAC9RR77_9CLOT|nr:YkuS family protein [Clostridium formicaceticum]AOY75401.1 hypothetical protein BJL90_05485 [Clostridium formicaceticum]ARE89857.1 hypothetical protein CLFO_43400 [Clostridium formicaceticum]
MKRIAIQDGLEQLKFDLENNGYEVVDFQDKGHIDAIVYTDDYGGFKNLNDMGETNTYGAILINAKNKTVEEIRYIIETRRYGSLFS